jgi:hypothetical protein
MSHQNICQFFRYALPVLIDSASNHFKSSRKEEINVFMVVHKYRNTVRDIKSSAFGVWVKEGPMGTGNRG